MTDFTFDGEDSYQNLPSYLTAADVHNVGESGGSFSFSDPSSWYDGISSAGKFVVGSVVSGAAQLYNTGIATANFFHAGLKEADTAALMTSIDSDLGRYYLQNRESVDVGGFVAGSFIPGIGSMKMLQAAKAGHFGKAMATGTNLLVPETENLILTAGKELANRQASFRAFDSNVLRAFGKGLQGAAAESVIAEATIAATMYKSPVLEDMTLSDLGANIFWGGLFGTAIGGAINSARIYGGVKKIVSAANPELNPVKLQTALPESARETDRIIMGAFDQERIAAATVESDILTSQTVEATRESTLRTLKDRNRQSFQNLSGDDSILANTFADGLEGVSAQTQFQSLFGAVEIGRLGKRLNGEADAIEYEKQHLLGTAVELLSDEMIVYHGTGADVFKSFDESKIGSVSGTLQGRGFYFAVSPLHAEGYAKKLVQKGVDEDGFPLYDAVPGRIIKASVNSKYLYDELNTTHADKVVPESILSKHFTDSELAAIKQRAGLFGVDESAEVTLSTIDRYAKGLIDLVGKEVADKKVIDVFASMGYKGKITSSSHSIDAEVIIFSEKDIKILDNNYVTPVPAVKIGYVPLFGNTAGVMSWEAPVPLRLADKIPASSKLDQAIRDYGFTNTTPFARKSAVDADAQYLWASRNVEYRKDMVVAADNIPVIKTLAEKLAGRADPWKVVLKDEKGVKKEITNLSDLVQYKMQLQERVAKDLFSRRKKITLQEVAAITDLSEEFLLPLKQKGSFKPSVLDYDYRAGINLSYSKELQKKGLLKEGEILDVADRPMWAKVSYDTKSMDLPSQFEYDAMNLYATKWAMHEASVKRAFSSILGESFNPERFVKVTDYDLGGVTIFDAAPGLFSSTNAGYDSLGSKMQMLGLASRDLNNVMKSQTDSVLNPHLQVMLADKEVAYEFNVINKVISQAPEPYVLDAERGGLVPYKLWKYENDLEAGVKGISEPELAEGMKEFIRINRSETIDAWEAANRRNAERYSQMRNLRNSQGLEDERKIFEANVLYPIRKDYRQFKHFAFVVDDTITGTGHVSMIHAKDGDQLAALAAKVPKGLKVITDRESERWHKAMGDYDYERSLHDNYIDSALKRAGIDSEFFLETDPQQIVTKILEHNYRADRAISTEIVRASNEKAFTVLEKLGDEFEKFNTSQKGVKDSRSRVSNPYKDYIRTALNLSTLEEDSLISSFNNTMDSAFTKMSNAVAGTMAKVRNEKDLDTLNGLMEQYGVKGAYHDAAIAAYQDVAPDRGALTRFVQRANTFVSTFALGTDPFHAIANTIGNNVMLGSELSNLVGAIRKGNPEVAGRLALLAEVPVPGSNGAAILSPAKMIARANAAWLSDLRGDRELSKLFTDLGFDPSYQRQLHAAREDLIITGSERPAVLDGKISKTLQNVGEIMTAPVRLSEQQTRFVTAHVAKQITDLAESAGIVTRNESLAIINTFMNRVQGAGIASQRPLVLQGPIGMAIGLFQTYQFNLLQQMFRKVGEGAPKDALMMLGLQGSIFGMNGLPAFNFINTHLIGTASGNQKHKDLYDATYGIAGKNVGDWLMYGIASNMTKAVGAPGTNIYTRGDMNPRQVTVLPTSLEDIPLVRAGGALWNVFAGTLQQLGAGAPVGETLTQALEHNTLSRPLAGLAQVLQAAGNGGNVYATDNNGVIRGTNDLLHITSLMRIAGARPMDESIANDYYHRLKVYEAKDRERLELVRDAVRKSVIQGNTLEEDEYGKFLEEYMKAGGKAKNFNKWVMKQYTEANTPATEKLAAQLGTPYAQRMQEFLRGRTITQADLGAPPLENLSNTQ